MQFFGSSSSVRVLVLPIVVFFVLSVIVYFAFQTHLQEIASVLLLGPLLLWLALTSQSNTVETRSSAKSKPRQVVLGTLALYLLVMLVRTPAVYFLGFPIEKTPLIYLLVLWTLYVERRRLQDYGLTGGRLPNQAVFGTVLYVGSQLIPFLGGLAWFILIYNSSPVRGVDLNAFVFVLPFQVLAVGVSEEGFFRGYIQTRLIEATGRVRLSILYQAFLFGVWHFVWHLKPVDLIGMTLHILEAFFFGLLAGVFCNHTKSISGLALFHGLTNTMELSLQLDFTDIARPFAALDALVLISILVVMFGGAMILLAGRITRFLGADYRKKDAGQTIPE